MTVTELRKQLAKLEKQGHGNLVVFGYRHGDEWCMQVEKVQNYESYIVLVSPNWVVSSTGGIDNASLRMGPIGHSVDNDCVREMSDDKR